MVSLQRGGRGTVPTTTLSVILAPSTPSTRSMRTCAACRCPRVRSVSEQSCPAPTWRGRFIGAVDDRRHLLQLDAQLVAGAANDIHFADHHRPEVCPAPGVAHAAADTASAAMQVR